MGKLTSLITSLLFVTLMFAGLFSFMGGIQANYNINVTNDYSNITNAFNSTLLIAETEESRGTLQNATDNAFNTESSFHSFLDTAGRSIGTAIRVFSTSGETASEMVNSISDAAGLPSWVAPIIITAIIITILLIIAGLIFGRDF